MNKKWSVIVILAASLLPGLPGAAQAAALAAGQKISITTTGYGCLNLDDLKTYDAAKAAGAGDAVQNAMDASCDYVPAGSTGTVTGLSGSAYIQVQMDNDAEDNWFDLQDVAAQ